MTGPGEHAKIDIGDASHLYAVQREIAFDVSHAGSCFKIGPAEIRVGTIETKPNFSAAFGLGELDMNIVAINGLFEQLGSLLWSQAHFHSMVAFAKSLNQAFMARGICIRRRW